MMRSAQDASRFEGTRYGKYTLVDRIAVGGMAELFLARQADEGGLEKTVVIKRIRHRLSKEPSFVRMFLNEAKLAAQLNHPNVVQIYDLGKVGETYYIAMEYLFGRDMRLIVAKADELGIPFPMVYAMKIASSICEGLHYAHNKVDLLGTPLNIVHRDVTPENIFVSFDGTVKILDFGIAKAATQVEKTKAGEIKGKVYYMSPEQCTGKPLDCRSDLFSLGVVLYEWMTGFRLFTGESELAILHSITEGKIYAPSYFREDIPEQVERILMKALEKDRDRRYQSAQEMKQDIDRFLDQYEFSPTNLHLANFLRQLFHEDLEEEKGRLVARHVHLGTLDPTDPSDSAIQDVPSESRRDTVEVSEGDGEGEGDGVVTSVGTSDERVLTLTVSPQDHEALSEIAKRHGLSPDGLAREIITGWLKYK